MNKRQKKKFKRKFRLKRYTIIWFEPLHDDSINYRSGIHNGSHNVYRFRKVVSKKEIFPGLFYKYYSGNYDSKKRIR